MLWSYWLHGTYMWRSLLSWSSPLLLYLVLPFLLQFHVVELVFFFVVFVCLLPLLLGPLSMSLLFSSYVRLLARQMVFESSRVVVADADAVSVVSAAVPLCYC